MKSFDLYTLIGELASSGRLYAEFIREPTLSAGLYQLRAGAADPQSPHSEDEVYYVISGSAQFTSAGQSIPVRPGSIIFVEAGQEHRFHDIDEDLLALVFFAPPEKSS